MDVLKDFTEEYSIKYNMIFKFLNIINLTFSLNNGNFFKKYAHYSFIIFFGTIHYITMTVKVKIMIEDAEIADLAYVMPVFLFFTQDIVKTLTVFWHSKEVRYLIIELGNLWRCGGLTSEQVKIKNDVIKKLNIAQKLTFLFAVFGTFQYVCTPLLENLICKFILRKSDCKVLLPIACQYPFEPTQNLLTYFIAYGLQAYSALLAVSAHNGCEVLLVTFTAFLVNEFNLLSEDLMHLVLDKKVFESEDSNNSKYKPLSIGEFIRRHQKLMHLTSVLNSAFNKMIFGNLLFVGLNTCFFIFAGQFRGGLLAKLNNYVAVVFLQTYVMCLCYFGEMLITSSSQLAEYAYDTPWYKYDRKYRMFIVIIMQQSQKPSTLRSMISTVINMNLFAKILSTTWSYISLMNTVYQKVTTGDQD